MITPGVVFSPGQLVTADMLNNLVSDAVIQDNSIESIKLKDTFIDDFGITNAFSDLDKILIFDQATNSTKAITTQDFFNSATKDVNAIDVNGTGDMDIGGDVNVGGNTELTGGLDVGGDTTITGKLECGSTESITPGFYVQSADYASNLELSPVINTYINSSGDTIQRNFGFSFAKYNMPGANWGAFKIGTPNDGVSFIQWVSEDNDLDKDGLPTIQNRAIDKSIPLTGQHSGLYFNCSGSDDQVYQFGGDLEVQFSPAQFGGVILSGSNNHASLVLTESSPQSLLSLYRHQTNADPCILALGSAHAPFVATQNYTESFDVRSSDTAQFPLISTSSSGDATNMSRFAFYHNADPSTTADSFTLYRLGHRAGSSSVFRVGSTTASQNVRTEFLDRVRFAYYSDFQVSSLTGNPGDVIYNTTQNRLQYWNGSAWTLI